MKWFLSIVLGGIVVLAGFKLLPVYVNNQKVKSIANEVLDDQVLAKLPKREIKKAIQTKFNDHNLDHLNPEEVVSVKRDSNGSLVLDLKYEERRKLLYNIELVAGFDEQFSR